VIVPELDGGYPLWIVIEPHDRHDTLARAFVADHNANVHVMYRKDVGGLFSETQPWVEHSYAAAGGLLYGRFSGADLLVAALARSKEPQSGAHPPELRAFEGPTIAVKPETSPVSLAVDPRSETVLAGTQWLLQNGQWRGPLKGAVKGHGHVIAAGNDAFHAIVTAEDKTRNVPVLYTQLLSGAEWSVPLQVGVANENLHMDAYLMQQSMDIAAGADGRVFIIWPAKEGLMGRWVEGMP
jgi:hypothetical protein